jgi:hypothetical protein
MLHDGVPYSDICKKLAERGHTLNSDNLSSWRAGGHQDWLREQAWLDEMRARLDFASDIFRQENGELLEAGSLRIAIVQLYSFLATFNPATLSKAIATQPGAYARILNVLCKITDSAAKLERRRLEKEAHKHEENSLAKLSILANALSSVQPNHPSK